MSTKKDHQSMDNLEQCFRLVQQSSAKGISAIEISEKLGKHRTTIHGYLTTLSYTGRVESRNGLWYPKTGQQTIMPLEKEIVIELPMPKEKWADIARLQVHADYLEGLGWTESAKIEKTLIEQFNQTRRIRIIGRNVDDIDMEKVGNLILQANEKSSQVSFKRFFKNLKIPQLSNEIKNNTKETSDKQQIDNGKTKATTE
jgi:hypothetical protein